jgi:hypothetical protein
MRAIHVIAITLNIVMCLSLFAQQLSALDIPAGVFAPKEGGYVYAENSDAFDGFTKKGITIEIWFYLLDIPEDWREEWDLIDKPYSYDFRISGNTPDEKQAFPDSIASLGYLAYGKDGGGGRGRVRLFRDDLKKWHHFAYQILGTGPIEITAFIDGKNRGRTESNTADGFQASNDLLFIGGRDGYKSINGWIDEIRISKGWRYVQWPDIEPEREFKADEKTLALWHFDEGSDSRIYRDSSGNGHTLYAGGTSSVDSKSKSVIIWGMLKKQ